MSDILNSDQMLLSFGNYGIDVLPVQSDMFPESRIANLYSQHGANKIMRTLAVVEYHPPFFPELSRVHQRIKAGVSMGLALKKAGFSIHKQTHFFGEIALSPTLNAWMHLTSDVLGVFHYYTLAVSNKDQKKQRYGTIIEVHSPEYLSLRQLRELYSLNVVEKNSAIKTAIDKLSQLIKTFPAPG